MTLYSEEWFRSLKTGDTGALLSKFQAFTLRFTPIVPIGLAAAFPRMVAPLCFVVASLAFFIARVATPLTDVYYGVSGLLLHRWPAKPRLIAWSKLSCVSVRLRLTPRPVLVFHVPRDFGEDRYSIIFMPSRLAGPPLPEILQPLAALMPHDVVVERHRPSVQLFARLSVWQLVCGAIGFIVATVVGEADWRAVATVTLVGWGTIVFVLFFGSQRPIALSAGLAPPDPRSIPRTSRPWIAALTARSPVTPCSNW